MVRTAKVCATVQTVHAATTSTEAAYASRASVVHTAGTGCVDMANTACTVNAPVSARTSTHSGEWASSGEEEDGDDEGVKANISLRRCYSWVLVEINLSEW